MSLKEFTAQVRARLDAATPGPWLNGYPNAGKITMMPDHVWSVNKDLIGKELSKKDAKLIASAPTDLDRALRIIEVFADVIQKVERGDHQYYEKHNSDGTYSRDYFSVLREALEAADQIARGEK